MKMNFCFSIAIAVLFFASTVPVSAQDKAEGAFKQTCAACHSIGKGKLVGPDLLNVQERRTEEWLLKFIKSSQSMIKSGDKYADSLFQAYNQVIMPDQPALFDGQIKDILTYIKTKSSGPAASVPVATAEQSKQKARNDAGILFSATNIILFILILFLLIVIFFLSRTIKNLSEQLMDYYSSDRSFF